MFVAWGYGSLLRVLCNHVYVLLDWNIFSFDDSSLWMFACTSSPNHKTHDSEIKNKLIKKIALNKVAKNYTVSTVSPPCGSTIVLQLSVQCLLRKQSLKRVGRSSYEHNEKHGALSLLLWETVCTHNTPHQALRVIDFPFRELEHSCAGV